MSSITAPKTILVAGASGFLGARVCENFLDLGYEVLGIDNFQSGNKDSLAAIFGHPRFSFFEADLTKKIPAVVFKGQLTAVIHLASIETYSAASLSRLNTLLVNAFGVKNLLDFSLKKKARFVFSSSVDIYEGLANRLSLNHYYDGRETTVKFAFLEAKRFSESLASEYFQSLGLDVRIARLPEVYGPKMNLLDSSLTARVLKMALENKDLIIDEDGSQKKDLLYVDDAAFGLAKLALDEGKDLPGGIFYLVNPEPVSVLSVVYAIRELVNPKLKTEFLPQPPVENELKLLPFRAQDIERTRKVLGWKPLIDLSQGLRRTVDYFKNPKKQSPESLTSDFLTEEKQSKETPKLLDPDSLNPNQPLGKKGSLFSGLPLSLPKNLKGVKGKKADFPLKRFLKKAAGLLLGSMILWFFLQLFLLFSLKKDLAAAKKLTPLDNQKLASTLNVFKRDLFWQRKFLVLETPIFWFLGQSKVYQDLIDGLDGGTILLNKTKDYLGPLDSLSQNWQAFSLASPLFGGAKTDSSEDTIRAIANDLKSFSQLSKDLSTADGYFQKIDPQFLPRFLIKEGDFLEFRKTLQFIKETAEQSTTMADTLPEILKNGTKQKYLLLFQNNTEIRATGGFIGSYGLLSLENGFPVSLEINDIYNLDGQIQTHLPSPGFLQKYLSVSTLGIRDANYSPDFPQSAKRIAFLFEDATGEKINGVLAMNLKVMEKFLEATGPIYLSDYKETITSQNLFEKAEIQSEIDFKPGVSRKKDFLGSLSSKLLEIIKTKKDFNWGGLVFSLAQGLQNKDLMFYFSDDSLQQKLSLTGWLGEMKEAKADYLWLIDNNVSANKANLWVRRSGDYIVDVDRDGNLLGTLTVHWENQATSQTWPAGDYKNYLKIFLPPGTKLIKAQGFSSEIEIGEEGQKTFFSGLVEAPISSKKEIKINYKLPDSLSLLKKSQYSLLIQKQSGIGDEPFSFKLNLPVFLQTQDKASFDLNLTRDFSFSLTTKR